MNNNIENFNLKENLDIKIDRILDRNSCYPLDLKDKFDNMINNCFNTKKTL